MGAFVHLHLHSEYSLLDGACRIAEIPRMAKKMGHNAVAITDHGVLYGAVAFFKACEAEGIRPIIGCEVYVARRTMQDREREADGKSYHLILLVKNETGYKNLITLVSRAFTEGFYNKPRIDWKLLEQHSEGLIALSACLAGYIPQAILAGEYAKAKEHALEMERVFGHGNYYLELQDHGLRDDAQVLAGLARLSAETGIPMAATNDVHYLQKKDAESQSILLCVQTNSVITDGKPFGFETNEFYYKSTEEMEALFGAYPGAVENTAKIADMCRFSYTFGETKLPRYTPENGMEPGAFLRSLAFSGLDGKTASGEIVYTAVHSEDVYRKRIDYELSVIAQMGYSEYYLVVWDFVHYAKGAGIPVGPGRGSGAGSLVAYLIGITDIDSIRYDLLFERFLNPERVSMPDFDIDFCYNRRDEVITYVREKYGEAYTAQIITFGTLAARAVLRDVGRALGMPAGEVDAVARKIPQEPGMTLTKAYAGDAELRSSVDNEEAIGRLWRIALSLEGMPRHASTHAAGVVITDKPVTEYVPVAVNGGTTVTQFDMDTIAELGLLKFDFLALRYLTILRDAEAQIQEQKPEFSLRRLDMQDSETYATISAGKTDGVFQLESEGMRQMLMQLQPHCLEDIIAAIALYRPGPMDSIPQYIEARQHPEKVTYAIPATAKILDVTYGCIVYQEQVMQIFREVAGYSFGHADVVRRAISKKKQGVLEKEKDAFLAGAAARNVSLQDAEELFSKIVSFANYAFNKSHATAYAVLSYQTAYLRTHYPLEYTCALLSSVLSQTGKLSEYMTDCTRRGIRILPPDINSSHATFHAEGNAVRFGLSAIKNIGGRLVETIVEERQKNGEFHDLADFVDRMHGKELNRRQLEAFIKAGAMDSLGAYRSQMLAVYETLLERAGAVGARQMDGQMGMFDGLAAENAMPAVAYPDIAEYSGKEKLMLEKEALGFTVSGHLLDEYQGLLSGLRTDSIADIRRAFEMDEAGNEKYHDKSLVTLAGVVTKRTNKMTKNGEGMAFVELEDRSGEIEVICFPKGFAAWGHMLSYDAALIVKGTLNLREDEVKVIGNKVIPLMRAEPVEKKEREKTLIGGDIRLGEKKDASSAPVPDPAAAASERTEQADSPSAMEGEGREADHGKNAQGNHLKKLYIRLDSRTGTRRRQVIAFCRIFSGSVPVVFYYADTGSYEKSEMLSVAPTGFVWEELGKLCGAENVVYQ